MRTPAYAAQESYIVEKLSENFYAALVKPGGKSTTNAFFFISGDYVVAGGAHMTKESIADLWSAINTFTHKPIRYFILTHHHPGFSQIDTEFPSNVTLVLSGDTWKNLEQEFKKPDVEIMLFSDGLTLKSGKRPSLVLSNIGSAHTDGDTIVISPDEKIAYVGDLLYVQSVGYMGDGHMLSWLQSLDFLASLELEQIIPGYGSPVSTTGVNEFRTFFRDFLSEVLTRVEAKESADMIKKKFDLPKYKKWSGYKQFLRNNAAHAWLELKADLTDETSQ